MFRNGGLCSAGILGDAVVSSRGGVVAPVECWCSKIDGGDIGDTRTEGSMTVVSSGGAVDGLIDLPGRHVLFAEPGGVGAVKDTKGV